MVNSTRTKPWTIYPKPGVCSKLNGVRISSYFKNTVWGVPSFEMFSFVFSEVPVTKWAAQWLQYQPKCQWNM